MSDSSTPIESATPSTSATPSSISSYNDTPIPIPIPTPTPTSTYVLYGFLILLVLVLIGVGLWLLIPWAMNKGSGSGSKTGTHTGKGKGKGNGKDKKCTESCDSKCTCPKGTECDSTSKTCKTKVKPCGSSCDSNCTCPDGTECDSTSKTCKAPGTPGTYTSIPNTNTESRMGCPYTIGLTSSSANEGYVKNTCDADPKCVGYYVGSAGWNIATQTLPSECTDNSGADGYSVFKSKSSNYTSAVNPKNKFGCIYTPGLTTSDANEDYVKKTCDVDPKCAGYYKGSNWFVASQTLPTDCKNATGEAGYNEFMKKS